MPAYPPPSPPAVLIRAGLDAIGAELAMRLPLSEPRHRAMASSNDLVLDASQSERIAVTLARLDERQKAMQDTADARHGQLVAMLAEFVPRAEIDAKHANIGARIGAIEDRVGKIEARTWKVVAGILSAVGTALASAITLHFRGG
ncbi:hypothetical protein E4V01_07600 [Methylorubrum sp. Q1]|uniref:hypothetical protein n=1 Tax=Methylorubrum sp. Q1 TaxID=2562453 RepID=UPI001075EAB0|nr:hypothetical protein [Methylorubrum sp. Q1]TFZ59308.1 hypothetical protein E4V01_07600 [Methylorubrum sp. Q1]